jgi:predicted O-methyltransferase YrrM
MTSTSTEELTKQAQWQKLFNAILGYQTIWIADIGLKTGLFRAIADSPAGIEEDTLAHTLGFAPRYVQVWCRAAYALELLDWEATSGYRLAPHMTALLLDPADPQYRGGGIQFYAAINEDFRAFPQYLPTGEIWPRSAHDPWLLEALKNSTKPDPMMITEAVLPQAKRTLVQLEQGGTMLDIGAGAGFALIHYATRFPHSRVVGLEYDSPSVELAQRAVAQADLSDRIEVRHSDANTLADENVYDLVTLNLALHETGSPEAYRNVLSRVRRALKPGGTVVVSELPYPDTPGAYRDIPVYKAMAGIQVHEALVGCGMITQGELHELLTGAKFSNVRVASQPQPVRFVMLAEKQEV